MSTTTQSSRFVMVICEHGGFKGKAVLVLIMLVLLQCMPAFGQTTVIDWINKGNALYNLSKYNESIEAYNKAIQLNPKIGAGDDKGTALNVLGRTTEANAAFVNAKELRYTG